MKYYCIAELEIKDQRWIPSYVENVTKMIEERGGRYLARTSNVERLEGERGLPHVLLILEWPSKEAALDFYESEEYKPYLKSRTEGTRSELLLVAGEDITGASQLGR
jgi:uncharacterized protein (DUF1330 family)